MTEASTADAPDAVVELGKHMREASELAVKLSPIFVEALEREKAEVHTGIMALVWIAASANHTSRVGQLLKGHGADMGKLFAGMAEAIHACVELNVSRIEAAAEKTT